VRIFLKFLAILFGALFLAAACVVGFLLLVFRASYPPQPKLGYAGDWRVYSEAGLEERRLPSATNIWPDYSQWKPRNEFGLKTYIGYLGGSLNQKNFRSWQSRGDTPMGAQDYTNVEFDYQDRHYGPLHFSWQLRGKHSGDFLKFDDSFRFYQIMPYGNSNSVPPTLEIVGIEGVRPEFLFDRIPTNTFILSAEQLAKIRDANQSFNLNAAVK
jgi:hypothetical protein